MKVKLPLLVIILMINVSCQGQINKKDASTITTKFYKGVDTLSALTLNGKKYQNSRYTILHLLSKENEREQLKVLKNSNLIALIPLPISDEELKNFSVNNIAETQNGFKIDVSWGGGNYFYCREFHFIFQNELFYLDNIKLSNYSQQSEKEINTINKVYPKVPIKKFNITTYLNNK